MSRGNPSSWDVPEELRESLLARQCVLCVGAGFSVGPTGIPLGRSLAAELAQAAGYQGDDMSLPRVAQYFEMIAGRHALTRFLVGKMSDPGLAPQASHRLIAALPLSTVVTTNFDRLLEQHWERIGLPYDRVIRNEDLSYAKGDRITYVKMHGSIDMPDSLVVTEDDYERYFEELGTISIYLKALLASRTLLFVGYSLADANFKRLYVELTGQIRRHMRRAYAVQTTPSDYDRLWWSTAGRNVHLIEADGAEFLEALAASLRERPATRQPSLPNPPAPREPYKFLNYYEADDRAVFFGRDEETREVASLILAHRLTLLFGLSGVGKTSLIRAGVGPQLASEGYEVAHLRVSPGQPADLRRLLVMSAGIAERASSATDLDEYLRAQFGEHGRVVVILDQAEELFTRQDRSVRMQWRNFLEKCRGVNSVDLRLCLVVRDEFLGNIADLIGEPAGTDILSHRFKLWKLGPEQGRQCITRPAARFGAEFEPTLVNQLVEDLDDRGVDPAHLQVLCSTLYRSVVAATDPDKRIITVAEYKHMGGAQEILANYLEQALEDLVPENREIARAVLKSLVTNEATKDVRVLEQLLREALVRRTGADLRTVESVVEALSQMRLIRKVPQTGAWELVHDVLATRISDWITEDEALLKSAQRAIREGRADWASFGETLTRGHWSLINENADELSLQRDDVLYLLQQALLLGDHLSYWTIRAAREGAEVVPTLRAEMSRRGYVAQENVLSALTDPSAGFPSKIADPLKKWCAENGDVPARRWARRTLLGADSESREDAWAGGEIKKDLVPIPPGVCTVGSDDSPIQDAFEGPKHEVFVGGFHIAKYPITNIQYLQYVRQTGTSPPENWTNGEPERWQGEYPVVYVSWKDAMLFCEWLSSISEQDFRLPTEAEWEKAASWSVTEGKALQFGYGDEFDAAKCNTRESGLAEPTAVGYYSARGGNSPYGVADMTGNVWEWISTRMASAEGRIFNYPYSSDDGREDTRELSAPRILRGGSCYNTQINARCSTRFRINPHYRNGDIGFRVACTSLTDKE